MDGLGTELPQRHTYLGFMLVAALVFAVPCFRMARRSWSETGGTAVGAWAMTAVMVLVLVVAPLLIARSISTRHTFVSDEAVTLVSGDTVRQQIAFADITEIRVRYSGTGGNTFRNEKVFLVGPLRTGSGTVMVSRMYVDSLQPLLERLAAEVAERPELLTSDIERDFFERAVSTAP